MERYNLYITCFIYNLHIKVNSFPRKIVLPYLLLHQSYFYKK